MDESERLRVLRPNFQLSIHTADREELKQIRADLDTALRELTRREIEEELHLPGRLVPLPDNWPSAVQLFLTSPAMYRYVNSNLFFGARLFAWRKNALPEWVHNPKTAPARRSEQKLFGLTPPPVLPYSDQNNASFSTFQMQTDELDCPADCETEALHFLDGGFNPEESSQRRGTSLEEPNRFELWLRGLRPEASDHNELERFRRLKSGITWWAKRRSDFYLKLAPPQRDPENHRHRGAVEEIDQEACLRPSGGWSVYVPLAARFGLADLYWIASILRADVTAGAAVTHSVPSWIELLRIRALLDHDDEAEKALSKAGEVLRAVLGSVTSLVQNAIEISSETEHQTFEPELFAANPPKENAKWRQVFDEELDQIAVQRQVREHGASEGNRDRAKAEPQDCPAQKLWCKEVMSGDVPRDLMGIALSGGGIRSATFGLGALQALQELDFLRSIDYISTVSGGGFIGSWLTANVSRTKHWLGRLTDWRKSIAHLRNYSSYLSPITGVLSVDWWAMWALYLRNAFLIQLTGFAWLLSLLLAAWLTHSAFTWASTSVESEISWPGGIALLMALVLTAVLIYNFVSIGDASKLRGGKATTLKWVAITPACLGSFLAAAVIWRDSKFLKSPLPSWEDADSYSHLLLKAFIPSITMLGAVFVGLWFLGAVILSSKRRKPDWGTCFVGSFAVSLFCTSAFYLQLCAIIHMFVQWQSYPTKYNWFSFVFGPSLVLIALVISVILVIGFCGRFSNDAVREWLTRLGALLTACSAVYLAVAGTAVLGPFLLIWLLHSAHPTLKWLTGAAGVASTVAGLLAGNSAKTNGLALSAKGRILEMVAKLGGFVFLCGSFLAIATVMFVFLQNALTDENVMRCSWFFADCYWSALHAIGSWPQRLGVYLGVTAVCGFLFSYFFDINAFGLSQFYTNRLVRCYLGASKWLPGQRRPQPFTDFDSEDDIPLDSFTCDVFRGPFPIINCSLNLGGSADLSVHTRHSSSFFLTPCRCGSDRRKIGFVPTKGFSGGITLGQATAVSGAAVSPNMGYNTSPIVAFLLTMFNVRLGWWFPNPGRNAPKRLAFGFWYLFQELIGTANENKNFVNVSDGGHFENLGIYELVRRCCRLIIAVDAECDEFYNFGSLGNLVRICESDFGAKIEIDVSSIRPHDGYSLAHSAVGKITYSNGATGLLLYIKSSVTSNEDVGVSQYRATHPTFPHETTADQWFSEDQFESYRRLGRHAVAESFQNSPPGGNLIDAVDQLHGLLAPAGSSSKAFLSHAKELEKIWERFQKSERLIDFVRELSGDISDVTRNSVSHEETYAVNQLLRFMENVFLDLRLDDYWCHPDNRGWAMLFTNWARCRTLRNVWNTSRRTYGIRFENFCAVRLGFSRDVPAAQI